MINSQISGLVSVEEFLKNNGSIWVIGSYHNIFRIGSFFKIKAFGY